MLREASSGWGVDFPLADLLADKPGESFLDGVTTGSMVGEASFEGNAGHHFLFCSLLESSLSFSPRTVPRCRAGL